MDSHPHHGTVIDRRPVGGGASGRLGVYVVRDEDDGRLYSFDYTDIVTEGFRTVRVGERLRFHPHPDDAWRACYVVRLDVPDAAVYYR